MSKTKICTEEMGKWLKILFWLLIISTGGRHLYHRRNGGKRSLRCSWSSPCS